MTLPRLAIKPLVVLTADQNARFALRGILSREKSFGIPPIQVDYHVHPEKDPGVLRTAHDFLRIFTHSHRYALVIMDREGSGKEAKTREEMEKHIEIELERSGWQNRCAAVVIDPELDLWVWSDSPHVDYELGWSQHQPDLRSWLRQQGFLPEGTLKPPRPKEALEAALRVVRKPRSSAIYQALAEKVSMSRCSDPAFLKLSTVLKRWFAVPS